MGDVRHDKPKCTFGRSATERDAAAARLEDRLQREMAYGLGVDIAALTVDEVVGPILAARGSAD
jgi:hypothetical protein